MKTINWYLDWLIVVSCFANLVILLQFGESDGAAIGWLVALVGWAQVAFSNTLPTK